MRSALLLALVGSVIALRAAEPSKLTVADYFQKLPADTFEVPAPQLWRFVKATPDAIVDVANGYIRCTGDGAQGNFVVALFRYKDGQPLVAVSQADTEEMKFYYLHFFRMNAGGKLEEVPRKIFPVKESDRTEFELPRHGRTIVVRDTKSGKVRSRYTWDGEKFVKE